MTKIIELNPEEVAELYYEEGVEVTCTHYNICLATLYSFLRRNKIKLKGRKNNSRPCIYVAKECKASNLF